MNNQRNHVDTSSEWVDFETKVPDQVPSIARDKVQTISVYTKGKGKKGKAVKLRIPRSLFPELKRRYSAAFWDAETLDIPTSTASSFNFFSQVAQGVAADSRLGDSIFVEKVVVRLYLEQSTGITFTTADFAAVFDQEPAAGAPAWTDIFQGVGAASAAAYHVAIPNYDKRFRFRYANRATVPLSWSAAYWNGSSAVVSVHPVTMTLEIPVKRRILFDNTSGRPIRGCELMLWGWSDTAANTPRATASYEIFFADA